VSPVVPGRFAGKVAIVTGAASGIGRATARRLSAEGAKVACVDVSQEALEEVATEIGERATALPCDVSDPEQVRDTIGAVAGQLGPPDVCCNIAGIGHHYDSVDMPFEDWQRIIAVNLTGTWLVCQAVLPHMLDRGGVIVNTASTAGLQAQPYAAAYSASKAGVVMLTKGLALEYADRKVRVNAVAPGGVDTPLIREFAEFPEGADMKRIMRYVSPMGFCQPEDQASLFAYVASDEAHYMTGAVVPMDGGITL
jgi:NAD(P)-dependent dehydrogenase (short-subunit alcohol dehydrogenase family)